MVPELGRGGELAMGMHLALQEGGIYVPGSLLVSYRQLGLDEQAFLLLLQLMYFRQAESVDFPTPEQLAARMGMPSQTVSLLLQRLMKEGFLDIDEQIDPVSGVHYERYNWTGWFYKVSQWASRGATGSRAADGPVRTIAGSAMGSAAGRVAGGSAGNAAGRAPGGITGNAAGHLSGGTAVGNAVGNAGSKAASSAAAGGGRSLPVNSGSLNLFTLFEQEFGRPLSPFELETISNWLDNDRYADELIRFALKEAVFAGKLHFKYIDRILLEWSRNRVTSVDEARVHTQRYRGNGNGGKR